MSVTSDTETHSTTEDHRLPICAEPGDWWGENEIFPVMGREDINMFDLHQIMFRWEVLEKLANQHGVMSGRRIRITIGDIHSGLVRHAGKKLFGSTIECELWPSKSCHTVLRSPNTQMVITLRMEVMKVFNAKRELLRREFDIIANVKTQQRDFRDLPCFMASA